jgi:hypothetical protein
MDFLLECIGFPPSTDVIALAERVRSEGEPVALRGPGGVHLRVPLPGGIEVRLDREEGQEHDSLWPCFASSRRLRVAVEGLQRVPDSPYDVLLHGRANPPVPERERDEWHTLSDESYPLATYLWDARRLPRRLPHRHVLAVSLAAFALDVTYVGPNEGVRSRYLADEPGGSVLLPLAGSDQPGGCMELSLPVREIRHLENPLTREPIDLVEADAPGRPLELFLSRWQLAAHGLPAPRPGWRIEGAFLFNGRIAGGLPVKSTRTP